MLVTHSSVCLSCLITPSVQKPETTAQTPLGKRLIRKHTVRIFQVHMFRVLITEFTFHPHIPCSSLGIGRASVMALRVHTGSDQLANREINTQKQTHKLLIKELLLTSCSHGLSDTHQCDTLTYQDPTGLSGIHPGASGRVEEAKFGQPSC